MKRSLSLARAWRTVAVLTLIALLAACAPGAAPAPTQAPVATQPAPTPAPAKPTQAPAAAPTAARLRASIVADEATLNPYTYVSGTPGWNLLMLQYDSLYQVDVNGQPQPWLATKATVSPDGRTYSLVLREGVKWHDGKPLTAADVKFAFDFYIANKTGRFARALRAVESVAADGAAGLTIKLKAPSPSFVLQALADVPIIPQHIWKDVTTPKTHVFPGGTNIGTGPYKLAEYKPDQFYRFAANKEYFAGVPRVDELVLVRFADDAGSLAALRGKEIDLAIRTVAPEQIALLKQMPNMKIAQGPLFATDMFIYDMQRPPFNKLAVRKAIALAIDRQDIVNTVHLGNATVGNLGWIHPKSPFFNSSVTTEFNVKKATALLDEAGIKDSNGDGIREVDGAPLSFELLVPSNSALRLRMAELIKDMLKAVGMEVKVASVESTTWENKVWPDFDVAKGRNYQAAMWGWSAPVQADTSQTALMVHSKPEFGTLNLSGLSDPQADQLAEALVKEMDPVKYRETLNQLQALIGDKLPFVMLLYPDGAYAYWSNVYDGYTFIAGQGIINKLSFLPASAQPKP